MDVSKFDVDVDEQPAYVPAKIALDSFVTSRVISSGDLTAVSAIESIDGFDRLADAIKGNENALASAFTKLSTVSVDSQQEYILKITESALNTSPSLAQAFFAQSADPFTPYISASRKSNAYIVEKAFRVLGHLVVNVDMSKFQVAVETIIDSALQQLQHCNPTDAKSVAPEALARATAALFALQSVLRNTAARPIFVRARGVQIVLPLLHHTTVQLVYHAVACMWLLTYSKDTAVVLRDGHAIAALHDVLLLLSKEKTIRMVLNSLQNLLAVEGTGAIMVSVNLPRTLENLGKRSYGDEDISEQLKQLTAELDKNITELSSFDEYRQEVLSGHLKWSPPHTSEKFWRENLAKFEGQNFQILKELTNLLGSSEALTAAVACHDLGEFVRYHSRGKKIVTDLGAKTAVMELLSHADENVRREALLTTQKLMISNWEFASKS